VSVDRWRPLAEWRVESLAETRRRLEVVPIEQRLLEAIAWSAALLADDLRSVKARRERPLPPGLGSRLS
jgi:hypothetical protein